ncbi:hypothetical protein DFH09DRAFT_389893 [Mycena vulgaris]|nr:hypothetical protein DFH09DRAFT_389893 [Mycena vulgaris]
MRQTIYILAGIAGIIASARALFTSALTPVHRTRCSEDHDYLGLVARYTHADPTRPQLRLCFGPSPRPTSPLCANATRPSNISLSRRLPHKPFRHYPASLRRIPRCATSSLAANPWLFSVTPVPTSRSPSCACRRSTLSHSHRRSALPTPAPRHTQLSSATRTLVPRNHIHTSPPSNRCASASP